MIRISYDSVLTGKNVLRAIVPDGTKIISEGLVEFPCVKTEEKSNLYGFYAGSVRSTLIVEWIAEDKA